MRFFDRLADRIAAVDSVVSVGLDPDPDRLPEEVRDADLPRWAFNRRIVDATHEHAACFKPNAAFYEDPDGWRALRETVAYAHGKGVPVLLDAKRGDVGNTARQYARVFDDYGSDGSGDHGGGSDDHGGGSDDHGDGLDGRVGGGLGVDAITANPYLGRDALEPFLRREEAGVFVLARTSNPGGADLQDLQLAAGDHLYERVATLADAWNAGGNVGLVVGATAPAELAELRELVPELPFLVPGVGAQGGDAEAAVEHGLAELPGHDVRVGLVNSSRGIVFAGESGRGDYFAAAGDAAKRLKRRLNEYR